MRRTTKSLGEKVLRDIIRATRKQYFQKRRYGSYWTVCVAKTALQNCIAVKQWISRRLLRSRRLSCVFSKKHVGRWGRPRMRYAASENLEIIRLIEDSHLSARQTLAKLGIPHTMFYRWYDRYLQRGEAGLEDQPPKPSMSGTAFLTRLSARSPAWLRTKQSCHHASWQ